MRVAFRSVRVGAGVPRTVERDARGGSDPVAGFDESVPQGGQFDVEESTAVLDYAAGDQNRVDETGMAGRHDRAGRVVEGADGRIVRAEQDHVGVLSGRETAGSVDESARRGTVDGGELQHVPRVQGAVQAA